MQKDRSPKYSNNEKWLILFLHRKTKDIDQDPCKDYQVLCGIEEEFLIINKDGTLVKAADELMVRAAEILERDNKRLDFLQLKIRGLDAQLQYPEPIRYGGYRSEGVPQKDD